MDIKAFLLEMGVKPDQIDAIVPTMTPEVQANIEKATLRQSDYSTKLNALDGKSRELDAANERLNTEMAEWARTQAEGEPITAQMRKDLADAKADVTRLQTVIKTRANELGLDPKAFIAEEPNPNPNPNPVPPAVDLSKYETAEQMNARLGRFAKNFAMLPAQLQDIADEHYELTGKRLKTTTVMDEVMRRAEDPKNYRTDGTPIKPITAREVWEEMNNIPQVRADRNKATHEAELKAAEDRGYERARTEQALPGSGNEVHGRHSVVLKRPEGHKPTMPRGPAQQVDRISSAASALATHRYRSSDQRKAS